MLIHNAEIMTPPEGRSVAGLELEMRRLTEFGSPAWAIVRTPGYRWHQPGRPGWRRRGHELSQGVFDVSLKLADTALPACIPAAPVA